MRSMVRKKNLVVGDVSRKLFLKFLIFLRQLNDLKKCISFYEIKRNEINNLIKKKLKNFIFPL